MKWLECSFPIIWSHPTRGGTLWQLQMPGNRDQLLSWQSTVHFNRFSASGQFDAAELIRYMITKPQRRQPDQTHLKLIQMSGDVHPNPGPATKYPCPVCTRNVTSRGVSFKCTNCSGWVRAKCSGIWNAAQYRRKSDWSCDACSAPQSQQSPPPTRSPAPSTKQISDDSTFNVLQLNANGIGNKLTELDVVLERNKVKVAVIQELKLSPTSKNPCIQNYTIVREDRSMVKEKDCWSSFTDPAITVQPITCNPSENRLSAWTNHLQSTPTQLNITPSESLATGSSLPWCEWQCLNRLRTRVGRCKYNMNNWGYCDDDTTCDCTEEPQTMEHLLNCPLLPQACTTDDLLLYNDTAQRCVKQWMTKVWCSDTRRRRFTDR